MLGEGKFESGMQLDFGLAIKALAPLAKALELSTDELARGIMRISDEPLRNAMAQIDR